MKKILIVMPSYFIFDLYNSDKLDTTPIFYDAIWNYLDNGKFINIKFFR